jgi:hypothetical protein
MERASEHAADLKAEIARFLDTNPYSVAHEFDRKPLPNEFPPGMEIVGVHRWRAQTEKAIPPRISILAGDVLKELRSALDYVAWQLALGQSATPPQTTAFPIFASEKLYARDKQRFIGGIDGGAHPIFDAVQPYHAGDKATEQPLWVLHRLANDDKHKMPHVVGSLPNGITVERRPGTDFFIATTIGAFDDGDVVGSVGIIRDPNPETEPKFSVRFEVAFGKDTPAHGTGLWPKIDQIGREVDRVIDLFDTFFP